MATENSYQSTLCVAYDFFVNFLTLWRNSSKEHPPTRRKFLSITPLPLGISIDHPWGGGGGMDIFWNCTMLICRKLSIVSVHDGKGIVYVALPDLGFGGRGFYCLFFKGFHVEISNNRRNREIRLARTQTSSVSEHAHKTGHYPLWNEVKFIDQDPHWYTQRVKEAIHVRLHPDNINRDGGIEIPEAWMPTIKKHNRKTVQQRITEGTTSRQNSEDLNAPITANQRDINGTA